MGDTTESSTTLNPLTADTPGVTVAVSGVPTAFPATVDDIYYVNNNEITGNSLVGEILTGRENFVKWRKAMRIALSARLKLGFVEGEHPRPNDPVLRARWQRCNDVIMSWLLCSVSPDVTGQILDSSDVADAWNCLHMMYAGSNLSRKFTLQQEITNLMQGTMTVAKYFEKLCGLWGELDAMRERRMCSLSDECVRCQDSARENHENKVMKFLMGLNENLAQIRTHILALETLPPLNVVFDRVSNHEAERNWNKLVPTESSAMYANHQSYNRHNLSNNQQYTQQSRTPQQPHQKFQNSTRNYEGNNTINRSNQRPFCTHCQQPGHTKETCWKIHGFPPGHRLYKAKNNGGMKANNTQLINDDANNSNSVSGPSNTQNISSTTNPFTTEQVNQLLAILKQGSPGVGDPQCHMAGIYGLSSRLLKSSSWIVDSGATDHFTCDESLLFDIYQLSKDCCISLPDGTSILITSARKCALTPELILQNVFLVPNFKFNLLSVGKLINDSRCSVLFTQISCVVQDSAKKTILEIGKFNGGLYLFQPPQIPVPSKFASATGKDISPDIWHLRLGHMPFDSMKTLLNKNLLIGKNSKTHKHCDVCHLAKQSRLKFPISHHSSAKVFDLIHCDLWGPFNTSTMNGSKYFLTIVDDKSRCTWTYLLKTKNEAPDYLIQFYELILTQFGHKIKVLRSDNGTEFFNEKMENYLLNRGCIHQSSCPYTPQQNGVAERKHRHLLNVARALRFQSHVPKIFWGDCILTATYLINRIPTNLLQGKSPYEVLFGSPPPLTNLKVFGCLCYTSTISHHRDKFDPRASPCVFLGYPYGQKGYKVYCLQSHRIIVSRNVIFYEDIFPFEDKNKSVQGTSTVPNPHKVQTTVPIYSDELFDDLPTYIDTNPAESNTPEPTSPTHIESYTTDTPIHETIPPHTSPNTSSPTSSPYQTYTSPIHETNPTSTHSPAPIRKSTRTHKPPKWQTDYICNLTTNIKTSPHTLNTVISYNHCSSSHQHFLNQVTLHTEPKTYAQAVKNPVWEMAMNKEIKALEDNNTWTISELPQGAHAIACKWIFRVKYHSDGSIERYKARLVAKGFTQIEGIDYHDTFAPVVKMTTVRCLLAIAAVHDWPIFQLDVDNAFLYGDLHEEVYMLTPPGFYTKEKQEGLVCRLQRSIYGLKQASRQWFSRFSDSLTQFGFIQSIEDYSLFTLKKNGEFIILLVYVDDVVITGTCSTLIQEIKAFIHKEFRIKDLGNLKYFLGIEVARSKEGIFINQRKYVLDILEDYNYTDSKPVKTPLETKHELSLSTASALLDPTIYRKLVGKLIYLTVTRPDLAFSVHILSQFMANPTEDHLRAAHRLLRYIKSAPAQGIFFSANSNLSLRGFCDADWASCPLTRRSVTGYCMLIGSSVVSWKTRKQAVVSRSSAESEYRSMAAACSEIAWLIRLLADMNVPITDPVPLYCDNQSAIHLARNPVFHERTKHVEVDCHFVRQFVNSETIIPTLIPTAEQPADLFTKALSHDHLLYLSSKLGLSNFLHSPT
ncbi:unnamed protein product [Rhodiola kirilowii]